MDGLGLIQGQLEHEIWRKSVGIALDGLIQGPCGHAINACQTRVQDHLLATDFDDHRINVGRNYSFVFHASGQ